MAIKKVIDIDLKITQSKIKIQKLKKDVEQLDGRTLKYRAALQSLRLEEQKLAANRNALINSNSKLANSNNSVVASATNMAKVNTKVVDSSGLANTAVQELGRGISDSAYGIQGVANNASQLGSLFAGLIQKTGGFTFALRSMWSAMMGPLGILLAFQAVTAFIQTDYFKAMLAGGEAAKKMADDQKEVNKALDEFGSKETLIESYYKSLINVNSGEKERAIAIQELKKLVPDLKDADFDYGENLKEVRKTIDAYVLSQASRIEIDKLVELNSKTLSDASKIRRIRDIKDEEEKSKQIKKFLEDQDVELTKRVQKGFNPLGVGGEFVDVDKTNKEIEQDFERVAEGIEKNSKPILDKIEELKQGLKIDLKKPNKEDKEKSDGLDKDGNLIDFAQYSEIDDAALEENKEVLEEYQEFLDGQLEQEIQREDFRIQNEQRAADERVRIADAEAKAKKGIQDAYYNAIGTGFSILKQLANDNKGLQAAGLIGENAVGIAKNIISTKAANAAVLVKYAPLIGGQTLAAKEIIANNINSKAGIAASVAATAKGLQALGKGGASGQNSQSNTDLTPRFNLIEGRDTTQVVDAVNTRNNQPVEAYVVSTKMTTQQELDRKISNTGSI